MNSRESVRKAIAFGGPDRVPVNHHTLIGAWHRHGDALRELYERYPADILSLDPLFCNVDDDDLTLCSNSPCLPGGNPWGITIGDHGEGCSDCGSTLGGAPWRRWASTVAW